MLPTDPDYVPFTIRIQDTAALLLIVFKSFCSKAKISGTVLSARNELASHFSLNTAQALGIMGLAA